MILTFTKSPIFIFSPVKLTNLPFLVLPESLLSSFLLVPSTNTSTTLPSYALFLAITLELITSTNLLNLLCLSSSDTSLPCLFVFTESFHIYSLHISLYVYLFTYTSSATAISDQYTSLPHQTGYVNAPRQISD